MEKLSFLEKIFSVKNDTDGIHKILRIFGVKFKFINYKRLVRALKLQQEQNRKEVFELFDIFVDIRNVPKARGIQRKWQLYGLEIFDEVKYVCDKLDINYWVDFGTLLGAIRHGGFIPWDDDIDIGMMRNDFDSFIDTFDKHTRNKDFCAQYNYRLDGHGYHKIIKIFNKNFRDIQLDIFVYDHIYSEAKGENAIQEYENIKTLRNKFHAANYVSTIKRYFDKLYKYNKEVLSAYTEKPNSIHYVIPGFDYPVSAWHTLFKHEDIFPLSTIMFEGREYKCPKNFIAYMENEFIDYMKFPRNQIKPHTNFENIQEDLHGKLDELLGNSEQNK